MSVPRGSDDGLEAVPHTPPSHWLTTFAFVCWLGLVIAWRSTHVSVLGSAAWVAMVLTLAGYLYNWRFYRMYRRQMRALKAERQKRNAR